MKFSVAILQRDLKVAPASREAMKSMTVAQFHCHRFIARSDVGAWIEQRRSNLRHCPLACKARKIWTKCGSSARNHMTGGALPRTEEILLASGGIPQHRSLDCQNVHRLDPRGKRVEFARRKI